MEHWVKVEFDYSGDPARNHSQEIKTDHYYRENDDGSILHVKLNKCINVLDEFEKSTLYRNITSEEFDGVLKETIDTMKINITTHKFIKE